MEGREQDGATYTGPPAPIRVQFPLIHSDGPAVELTNEQIYDLIEFP